MNFLKFNRVEHNLFCYVILRVRYIESKNVTFILVPECDLCIAVLQETTSSEVLTNSTNAASNTASNRVGSAAAIGLGVIFSLIGLAAILILLVLLRRRFGLCQSLSYRLLDFAVNFETECSLYRAI